MTFAMVKVLPEPVTPSSVWYDSPSRMPSTSFSIASGWSPAGRKRPGRGGKDCLGNAERLRRDRATPGLLRVEQPRHRVDEKSISAAVDPVGRHPVHGRSQRPQQHACLERPPAEVPGESRSAPRTSNAQIIPVLRKCSTSGRERIASARRLR